MDAVHDTIITITLPGVGTAGNIVARRGELAQVIEFPHSGRAAIERAIDCALVALEEMQLNPPPVFPDPQPEAKPAAPPTPKKTAKKQTEKKPQKPKLDAAPTAAAAPRVEQPKAEKPVEPAKPQLEQLSLF